VADQSRSDWRVLLPLDRARTVLLDVGAGWGTNSFGVAPDVACVVAAEKIGERIEWIAARAREDGVENLVPVRAELQWLPFEPSSFDVVVVNGVLEWAGLADPELRGGRSASPQVLQERFLRRLAAVLRPRGWLYVGIENRFGRMFWLGAPDHQGLRFTSLMPRPAARAYTALRAIASPRTHDVERDYRTWIYSLAGYRRMLEKCGFADVRAYAAIPGYNRPSVLVPLDGSVGPMRWFRNHARPRRGARPWGRRAVARAFAASGLEAWITNEYALVARRPEA
jgi:SAM-dependent methyltransferase